MSTDAKTIPLADSDEIGRLCLPLPWEVQKGLVTLQAHCVCVLDEEPSAKVRDLVGCISQGVYEIARELNSERTSALLE